MKFVEDLKISSFINWSINLCETCLRFVFSSLFTYQRKERRRRRRRRRRSR
ncbi:hypothetical protein ACSBR1_030744 [Camellia fascicularis]